MNDEHDTNEGELPRKLLDAARSYNEAQDPVPREAMWQAIERARSGVVGSVPARLEKAAPRVSRTWWLAAAAVALLAVGYGAGRLVPSATTPATSGDRDRVGSACRVAGVWHRCESAFLEGRTVPYRLPAQRCAWRDRQRYGTRALVTRASSRHAVAAGLTRRAEPGPQCPARTTRTHSRSDRSRTARPDAGRSPEDVGGAERIHISCPNCGSLLQ